jgi:DNA-directed RNA polymerase subunit RPC12/RpoP
MPEISSQSDRIILRCPKCQAKLKTSRQQLGQRGTCPRCRERVIVQVPLPSDADIALVPDSGHRTPPSRTR